MTQPWPMLSFDTGNSRRTSCAHTSDFEKRYRARQQVTAGDAPPVARAGHRRRTLLASDLRQDGAGAEVEQRQRVGGRVGGQRVPAIGQEGEVGRAAVESWRRGSGG